MDFLNVNEALGYLDLKESYSAAEFGCGTADFSLALAKALDKGRVYALDIQQDKLSVLKNKMALQKIYNISTIICDLEAPNGSTLKSNFLDIVLIPNVLFQSENRHAIMEEAKRILKPRGQLLVIDWLKPVAFGPKENLIDPKEVKELANILEISLKKEFALGDYHYGLIFIKG